MQVSSVLLQCVHTISKVMLFFALQIMEDQILEKYNKYRKVSFILFLLLLVCFWVFFCFCFLGAGEHLMSKLRVWSTVWKTEYYKKNLCLLSAEIPRLQGREEALRISAPETVLHQTAHYRIWRRSGVFVALWQHLFFFYEKGREHF